MLMFSSGCEHVHWGRRWGGEGGGLEGYTSLICVISLSFMHYPLPIPLSSCLILLVSLQILEPTNHKILLRLCKWLLCVQMCYQIDIME